MDYYRGYEFHSRLGMIILLNIVLVFQFIILYTQNADKLQEIAEKLEEKYDNEGCNVDDEDEKKDRFYQMTISSFGVKFVLC